MSKQLPEFKTDDDAIAFLEQNDLSDYLTKDNLFPANFEFLPKDQKVSLRLSSQFMEVIKEVAAKQGMSYQKYIRLAVERSVQQDAAVVSQ
jgi:predicted DNA binding CopG/RHH family protein